MAEDGISQAMKSKAKQKAEDDSEPITGEGLAVKQDEDADVEEILEKNLTEAEIRLGLHPDNQDNIEFAFGTLIYLKNFLNKYAQEKDNAPAPELKVLDRVLSRFRENPSGCITSFNKYIFPILGPKKYQFGLARKKEEPWKKKILEKWQIEDSLSYNDPIFLTPRMNPEHNIKLTQLSWMENYYTTKTPNDLIELYGGFRRQGKSTIAIWQMLKVFNNRGESLTMKNIRGWFKNNIIYTDEVPLARLILQAENDQFIIDEGYFTVFNEETMKTEVRMLAKNLNAAASRKNIYRICMSELTAATKPIQNIALMHWWIPRKGYAILYCKDKSWISTKDPLGLDKINNADYQNQREYWMTHNPYYITRMHIFPLPPRWYKEYEKIKWKMQMDKGEVDETRRLNTQLDEILIAKAIKAYEEGNKDLRDWFIKHDMPKKVATKYERLAMERIFRDKALEDEGIKPGKVEMGDLDEE